MIYINGRFLTQQLTGVQRYASMMTDALASLRSDLKIIVPNDINHTYDSSRIHNNLVPISGKAGYTWEQLKMRNFLNDKFNPMLIGFSNTGPLFYKNQIVTIHDLGFLNGEWHSYLFRNVYKILIPNLVSYSKHILTVSEFSKQQIITTYGVNPKKITVIYNAPLNLNPAKLDSEPAPFSDQRFILSVGSIDPRKNLKRLVLAFLRIADKDIKLLLVGNYNKNFAKDAELNNLIKNNKRIQMLGHVSDNMLIQYYLKAEVFVFPSLYEGFGLPPLEAMAQGCPVISSNVCSLPEVCGDSAIYCDPHSTDDIVEKINFVLSPSFRRADYVSSGFNQSKKFDWNLSAQKLNNLINSL